MKYTPQIITADYLYLEGLFVRDWGIVFDTKIIAVKPYDTLIEEYPNAHRIAKIPHSVLYPGLINTHVHLEFSANKTTLRYGSFVPWLDSVIADRNRLTENCTEEMMREACTQMLQSGITAFGAVSSFGLDLPSCIWTPQRVVFFNELIGSNPVTADQLYGNFLERFEASSLHTQSRVTPAIAIHSPYSVHPSILQKAVALAKAKQCVLSAHFLESQAERAWLEGSDGDLKAFFASAFGQTEALSNIDGFLSHFEEYPAHFVHCIQANDKELHRFSQSGHTVAHCPRSNRLLGCGRLRIEKLKELGIPFAVATDGLSSNYSLNIFDELRAALMMHHDIELHELSLWLLGSVTQDAARILGLNCGRITQGYQADFALVQLPNIPQIEEDIALWTILYTQKVAQLYIEGKQYV